MCRAGIPLTVVARMGLAIEVKGSARPSASWTSQGHARGEPWVQLPRLLRKPHNGCGSRRTSSGWALCGHRPGTDDSWSACIMWGSLKLKDPNSPWQTLSSRYSGEMILFLANKKKANSKITWHVHITLMFHSFLNLEPVSLQDGHHVLLTVTTELSQPLENI